jgi:hypothetical protein
MQQSAFGLNADPAVAFLPAKPNGFKQEHNPAAASTAVAHRGRQPQPDTVQRRN